MGADNEHERSEHENARQGDERAGAGRRRPEAPHDLPRTSTEMTPGIPVGSGKGIDEALEQPDSDLGGGVAGDTTARKQARERRDQGTVRNDDKDRTTL